jgi:hypothetical protein
MKRRDFLIQSAAGAMLPLVSKAQTPCPPSTLAIAGGTSVTTACSGGSAEADWLARTSGSGVVWFHDFRTAAEVNAFRWSPGYGGGNDPLARDDTGPRVRHVANDGFGGGGCLEILRPAGSSEGSTWIRPFAPLNAPGNGKSANDPGAGGTVPRRTWSASDGGNQSANFTYGWYGHTSYQSADPTHFDGNEFWMQMRVKRDPRRVSNGNQNVTVGKLNYIAIMETSAGAPLQELVIYSNGGPTAGQNNFRIYGGAAYFEELSQEAGSNIQPGGTSAIWQWNSGSWDTVMYHMVMGRQGVDETLIEVFGAHAGETAFTKFWVQTFPYVGFDVRKGLQALICSTYNNAASMPQDYVERWTQIIFSKEAIACPQV